MNKIKTYFTIGAAVMTFASCDSALDVVPEEDITTIESVFEQRSNVEEWEADCYAYIMGQATPQGNIGLTAGDELVASQYARTYVRYTLDALNIGDGVQNVQSPYGDIWELNKYFAGLRYCNIFLEYTPNTYNMEDLEKKQWMAEVKALKAFMYFEMLRRYGPIILVPKNVDVTADLESMKSSRRPIEECFDAIVGLIDEALEDGLLSKSQKSASHSAYFCRESALALKAKVLVYEASPFYNGNSAYVNFKNKKGELLFPQTYDAEKWRIAAEACDVALQECENAGISLTSGASDKSTALLNTMEDRENSVLAPAFDNSEGIFFIKYLNTSMYYEQKLYYFTLPRFQSTNYTHYNSSALGCLSPSMKMVEMYYTDHGLPIDEDPTWDYSSRYSGMSREQDMSTYSGVIPENTPVLNLHLRREPRFYADIATDRTYWQRGPEKTTTWGTDYNLLVKAYQGEMFGTTLTSIVTDAPQNLSGYWLKKFLYSDIATRSYANDYAAKGNDPFMMMRLPELLLMQAEAWNEYQGPSDKVYNAINRVRERAGIPTVQDAWARSYHPDKVKTKEGMREIIQQETNIELAFEGHRYWNLRRWLKAEQLNEPLYGWNVVADNAAGFYNNWQGPVVVWSKRGFTAPRDYLFPIRSEQVMISSIVQNPGW